MTQVSQKLLATLMFSHKIPVIQHLNEVLLLNRQHPQISAVLLFQVNEIHVHIQQWQHFASLNIIP